MQQRKGLQPARKDVCRQSEKAVEEKSREERQLVGGMYVTGSYV